MALNLLPVGRAEPYLGPNIPHQAGGVEHIWWANCDQVALGVVLQSQSFVVAKSEGNFMETNRYRILILLKQCLLKVLQVSTNQYT